VPYVVGSNSEYNKYECYATSHFVKRRLYHSDTSNVKYPAITVVDYITISKKVLNILRDATCF